MKPSLLKSSLFRLGRVALPYAVLPCVAVLAGCAGPQLDVKNMTPQQIAEGATGTKLLVHDRIERRLLGERKPLEQKCAQGGGEVSVRSAVLAFVDERNASNVTFKSVPVEYVCTTGGQATWGLAVDLVQPTFVPDGPREAYYQGTYQAAYESPETVAERRLARETEARDLQQALLACPKDLIVADKREVERLRVGSVTPLGTVTQVNGPLVLIQYIDAQRRLRQRDQEWLPLRSVMTQMRCAD